MKHNIKLIFIDQTKRNSIRKFSALVDGIILEGIVTLKFSNNNAYDSYYRFSFENKNVYKHKDYREIRAKLLEQMIKEHKDMSILIAFRNRYYK